MEKQKYLKKVFGYIFFGITFPVPPKFPDSYKETAFLNEINKRFMYYKDINTLCPKLQRHSH